ncbi:MAG: HAD domain-containing protein [Scrofimicrobium sp.]
MNDDIRPWLLIDIDGVLNPDWSNSQAKRHGVRVWHATSGGRRYRVLLNPEHGKLLLGMTDVFRLAWCTTWQHDANGTIRERLGLPELPVVEFDFAADGSTKVPGIGRFTAGSPFCWLDDDVWPVDHNLLATLPSEHLLITVNPDIGLQPEHLAQARRWAAELGCADGR